MKIIYGLILLVIIVWDIKLLSESDTLKDKLIYAGLIVLWLISLLLITIS
jgi:hypothetical protein